MSAETIDLRYGGRTGALGAWLAGEVLIDCGPSACVEELIAGLGERRPRQLLLTHIHFDHAGAAGASAAFSHPGLRDTPTTTSPSSTRRAAGPIRATVGQSPSSTLAPEGAGA